MNLVHGVHHLVQLPNQLMEQHVPFRTGSHVSTQQEPVLQTMHSCWIAAVAASLEVFSVILIAPAAAAVLMK
jgi:hypothetical protein